LVSFGQVGFVLVSPTLPTLTNVGRYRETPGTQSSYSFGEIEYSVRQGESVTALATEYGVSRQTVYNYKVA
jgi:hypothetical protein